MAKKSNPFVDAIDQMIKNSDAICQELAKEASKKMEKDFENMAKHIVDKYYEYKKGSYTKYGRTYQLYNIYEATTSVTKSARGYAASVNLTFDPSKMDHSSNSKQHQGDWDWNEMRVQNDIPMYGNVSEDYIYVKLFYYGKHPWYSGANPNDNSYKLIKSGYNVEKKFKEFIKGYEDKYLKDYIQDIFVNIMAKYI